MTVIETISTATVTLPNEALLQLAKDLDPAWAKIADGFTVSGAASSILAGNGLVISFRKNEVVNTAEVQMTALSSAPEFPMELRQRFTQEQRDEVRRILTIDGSSSFLNSTPEVQELVITKCLEMLKGEEFTYQWYLDNLYRADYVMNGSKFSFAPWEPTDAQKREAKSILSVRIPFGQLSDADQDKAVLDVLRKWHEDGEQEKDLRNAGLYVNYFKGSELYLTTEFGKEYQGRS